MAGAVVGVELQASGGVHGGEASGERSGAAVDFDGDAGAGPGGVEGGEQVGDGAVGDEALRVGEAFEDGVEHDGANGDGGDQIGEAYGVAGEGGVVGLGLIEDVEAEADDGGVGAEAFDENAGEFGGADHEVVGPAQAGV